MIANDKIVIDINDCTKCKMCVKVCPHECYYFDSDELKLVETFNDDCLECGHCAAICPVNIIALKYDSKGAELKNPPQEAIADYDELFNLVRVRRSIRHFKSERVPKELIEKILDLARYIPTGHNEENLHYTIVQDPNLLKKFSDEITLNIDNFVKKFEDPDGRASLKAVLTEDTMKKGEEAVISFKRNLNRINLGKDPWRWNAQLIIIHSPKNSATLIENCSIAACNLMLAARSLGLATCSLGYATSLANQFRSVSKLVKIPRKHVIGYTIAIGYPKIKYKRIPTRKPLKARWL